MPSLRSITGVVLASLVVVTIGAAPTRAGTATPAQKCLAAKHQAVGKKMACRLGCTAKAILKGLAVSDPTVVSCLSACGTTFSAAFTKAEQRGGCPTTTMGDAGRLEGLIDTALTALPLDEITYTGVAWADRAIVSALLVDNFTIVYPSGDLEVGLSSGGFGMFWTDPIGLVDFLPASGAPGPLTATEVNPPSSSSGVFGGDVVALKLNIDYSDARVIEALAPVLFGDFALCNVGTLPLNGTTVRQFLGIVNTLLGGGSSTFTIADLDPVTKELNASFAGGVPSAFAQAHLVNGPCVCPSPTTSCSSACVDLQTDFLNCGACGNVCPPLSLSCTGGVCQ